MLKGQIIRLYPTKEQQVLIDKTLGCCRYIYNQGLSYRISEYEKGKSIGYNATAKKLTELKQCEDTSFLKEVDSVALQQSLRDLDTAYKNFFKEHRGFPKYKSKHDNNQSYRTVNQGQISTSYRQIKLPKLGYIKYRGYGDISGIHSVTIIRKPSGRYYASVLVEFEPEIKPNDGCVIGLDVGIKEFYSDSNGLVVCNPKYLDKSLKKLVREQRKLSRKQKGSNNRNKQRIKVAKLHEHITNQRNDFLHKQSTMLVGENQTICIEDLNVKGMVRNHHLAKSISDVSWSKFFDLLEYKAYWYGCEIIKVPRFFASSQTCNCCGYQNKLTKNLAVRSWTCPECNTFHDRDTNAAINILNKGLSMAV